MKRIARFLLPLKDVHDERGETNRGDRGDDGH
jgi:hypothetical protein